MILLKCRDQKFWLNFFEGPKIDENFYSDENLKFKNFIRTKNIFYKWPCNLRFNWDYVKTLFFKGWKILLKSGVMKWLY